VGCCGAWQGLKKGIVELADLIVVNKVRIIGTLGSIISALNSIFSSLKRIMSSLNSIFSSLNSIISSLNSIISTLSSIISSPTSIISTLAAAAKQSVPTTLHLAAARPTGRPKA
jgi:phage-related protein